MKKKEKPVKHAPGRVRDNRGGNSMDLHRARAPGSEYEPQNCPGTYVQIGHTRSPRRRIIAWVFVTIESVSNVTPPGCARGTPSACVQASARARSSQRGMKIKAISSNHPIPSCGESRLVSDRGQVPFVTADTYTRGSLCPLTTRSRLGVIRNDNYLATRTNLNLPLY